jgi:hypothetical protein
MYDRSCDATMLWGPGDDQSLMAEPRPSTLHLSGHIIYNWKMCGHCWQQIFNYAPKGRVSKQISKIYNANTVQIQQLRCAKQNGVSSWTFSRGRRNVINAAALLAGMLHCQIIAFRFLIVEIFFWPRGITQRSSMSLRGNTVDPMGTHLSGTVLLSFLS